MNTNNKKPEFLHIGKNKKPLATAENLERLLSTFLVIHRDNTVYLNGKMIPVEVHKLRQVKTEFANRDWILHLKNLATIHGLKHKAIQYLPIIDFNQFFVDGGQI